MIQITERPNNELKKAGHCPAFFAFSGTYANPSAMMTCVPVTGAPYN
jgi:hypothetical protein